MPCTTTLPAFCSTAATTSTSTVSDCGAGGGCCAPSPPTGGGGRILWRFVCAKRLAASSRSHVCAACAVVRRATICSSGCAIAAPIPWRCIFLSNLSRNAAASSTNVTWAGRRRRGLAGAMGRPTEGATTRGGLALRAGAAPPACSAPSALPPCCIPAKAREWSMWFVVAVFFLCRFFCQRNTGVATARFDDV